MAFAGVEMMTEMNCVQSTFAVLASWLKFVMEERRRGNVRWVCLFLCWRLKTLHSRTIVQGAATIRLTMATRASVEICMVGERCTKAVKL